jgi:hypothetical protein
VLLAVFVWEKKRLRLESRFRTAYITAWKITYFKSSLEDLPELLALNIRRIVNFQVSALGHDLLGGKGALGVSPSGILPPLLDGIDLVPVLPVFGFQIACTHVGGIILFCVGE